MTVHKADLYALGAAKNPEAIPGTVCVLKFSTARSPGDSILVADGKLTANDTIELCYLPVPCILVGYNIDIPDLDAGTQLVMDLRDGVGNVIQTGTTVGQAPGRITDASADAGKLGEVEYTVASTAYLRLFVTTTAQTIHAATRDVSGLVFVKRI